MAEDVLELLEKLQGVADQIDRLEARQREATEARDRADEALQRAQRELSEREEAAHALDIERRKRELAIKDEKERMQRVKSRMADVKTSREYQAVLAEISGAKNNMAEQEAALGRELEELQVLETEIEQARARVADLSQGLAETDTTLAEVRTSTEPVVADLKAREDSILRTLPAEVVDRYRLIRTRRGGLAVVEARREACTACHMRIPPQTYIEVIRRSRVIQCPNCHRILIPPRDGPEQAE